MPGPRSQDPAADDDREKFDPNSQLARTAAHLVKPMQEAVVRYERVIHMYQRIVIAIGVLAVLLAAGGMIGGWFLWDGNYNGCLAGNEYRSEQNEVWRSFVGILVQQNKNNPAAVPIANSFLALTARVDRPRHCDGPPFS